MKVTSVIASIGQPITYYPALAKALESIPAAIFLAQLIYWTGKQADEGGWIYKTITAHSLRHYAGINYYKKSLDLKATQQFMGHNDRQTTEIYAQDEDNYKKNKIALEPRKD